MAKNGKFKVEEFEVRLTSERSDFRLVFEKDSDMKSMFKKIKSLEQYIRLCWLDKNIPEMDMTINIQPRTLEKATECEVDEHFNELSAMDYIAPIPDVEEEEPAEAPKPKRGGLKRLVREKK